MADLIVPAVRAALAGIIVQAGGATLLGRKSCGKGEGAQSGGQILNTEDVPTAPSSGTTFTQLSSSRTCLLAFWTHDKSFIN